MDVGEQFHGDVLGVRALGHGESRSISFDRVNGPAGRIMLLPDPHVAREKCLVVRRKVC